MSARLRETATITPLNGAVSVVGSADAQLAHRAAAPETELEKTLPIKPITTMVLLRQAIRTRTVSWRRPEAVTKLLAVAILAVLVVLLLRSQDERASTSAQTAPTSSATRAASPITSLVSSPARTPVRAQEDPAAVAPRVPSAQEREALPKAVVGAALDNAPADPAPGADPDTTALRPTADTVVYVAPGGPAVAVLPQWQMLSPTWVPVVDRRPGWALVMLPSRPHPSGAAAVGWIHLQPNIELVDGDRRVEFDTTTGKVVVLAELGRATTSSTLGATSASTATTGRAGGARSFVAIGGLADEVPWFLRMLWPFAGDAAHVCIGPLGGVAVPGLPAKSLLGEVDAIGCVATPPALRQALADVPAGAVVLLR